MAKSKRNTLSHLVEQYRDALEDCHELYVSCAKECARLNPTLSGEARREFIQRMVDLGHGLKLKIFVELAYVDHSWSSDVLVLAETLFEHVWGQELDKRQLKDALVHFMAQTGMTFDVLLRPFERMATFRSRVDEVQTVVMRQANLVAKADGNDCLEDVTQLRWIQAEMRRLLVPVPLSPDHDENDYVASKNKKPYQEAPFELPALPARHVEDENDKPLDPDVVAVPLTPEQQLEDTIGALDSLIGLQNIKQEVSGLVNFLKMQKAREEFNLPQTQISLHSVFSGNPGTGKTTVARLLGGIYGAMGILKRGHLVETDRSGLVAEYVGQTAPKAHKKIDEALDGVLFIDEAYSLVAESGDDPYGTEALQVLLKRMEDNRDRLIVILAGYPEPLDRLLKRNPGLSSRFSRNFHFIDYTAPELGKIFESLCEKNHYTLPVLTRVKALLAFQYLLNHRDRHFGNCRMVRNVFEQAIGRLANRIAGIVPMTREHLSTIEPEDIVFDNVPSSVWQDLDSTTRIFRIVCPGCKNNSRLPQRFLGHRVNCKRCRESFIADWGEVALEEGS